MPLFITDTNIRFFLKPFAKTFIFTRQYHINDGQHAPTACSIRKGSRA